MDTTKINKAYEVQVSFKDVVKTVTTSATSAEFAMEKTERCLYDLYGDNYIDYTVVSAKLAPKVRADQCYFL